MDRRFAAEHHLAQRPLSLSARAFRLYSIAKYTVGLWAITVTDVAGAHLPPIEIPQLAAYAPPLDEGLSSAEAERRLAEIGPNAVFSRRHLSVWSSIGAQLKDPLILVLLAAVLLTVSTGDFPDAGVIGFVVLVNSAVGVIQEVRADRAITALSQLSAPTSRVRRDGHEQLLASTDLVPGDVVILGEGDIVPADAVVVEASALLIDEAALTGESVPVGKAPRIGEHELSAGTLVVRGRAIAIVTVTGPGSALGKIAALFDTGVQATPLQRRLQKLGRTLAGIVVVLCAVVLALGLGRGEPTERMVVTAISLVVAAVPESLPAVITLSLALGARQMARRQAIVRRLPAVETLGSITVLATDKTGTLTTGRMRVEQAWTPFGTRAFDEGSAAPADPELRQLLTAGALCNDARLSSEVPNEGHAAGAGDPTELALLLAARSDGIDLTKLAESYPRVAEVPFDSGRQRMTTIHRDLGNGFLLCSKGAPEALLPLCELDDAPWKRASTEAADLAGAGYRVLAVATRRIGGVPEDVHDVENRLQFLGLVALADPPKTAAAKTIAACKAAGIATVLITGDHPATAAAIAQRVGIDSEHVFARVTPERKLDIVRQLRAGGEIVAMVGDGVNDGPALKSADIGVAMGQRGTEVARQAADLILADDDLATVVAAVQEGRRIYANVRRFLTYALTGGGAEILVMLVGPAVGLALPLLAAQILWVNLLTHGVTGVAMGAEPADVGSMHTPPRPPNESVIGDGLSGRVLRMSAVLAAVTLGLGWWADHSGRAGQSMMFLTLTALQLGVVLGLRTSAWSRANPALPIAVVVSVGLVLAGVYLPMLRDLLGTTTLGWEDSLLSIGLGVLGWIAVRLDRLAVTDSTVVT